MSPIRYRPNRAIMRLSVEERRSFANRRLAELERLRPSPTASARRARYLGILSAMSTGRTGSRWGWNAFLRARALRRRYPDRYQHRPVLCGRAAVPALERCVRQGVGMPSWWLDRADGWDPSRSWLRRLVQQPMAPAVRRLLVGTLRGDIPMREFPLVVYRERARARRMACAT